MNSNEVDDCDIIVTKIYKKRRSKKRLRKLKRKQMSSESSVINSSVETVKDCRGTMNNSIEIISEHIVKTYNQAQTEDEITIIDGTSDGKKTKEELPDSLKSNATSNISGTKTDVNKKADDEVTILDKTSDRQVASKDVVLDHVKSIDKKKVGTTYSAPRSDNLKTLLDIGDVGIDESKTECSNKTSENVGDIFLDQKGEQIRRTHRPGEDFLSLDMNEPSGRHRERDKISHTRNNKPCYERQRESVEAMSQVEDNLFQVDTVPAQEFEITARYSTKFSESALLFDKNVPARKSYRAVATCFNCGEEHALRDCTKRRDNVAINRNRNKFLMKKSQQMGNVTASRYHLDNNQRFAHLKPGKISRKLRKALKLSHDQLPLHIYKMRLLGYPPAWLEEAKVKHSGISVFDSSGNAVADPDDEDGELLDSKDRCKYDIKKLIDYPGFNVKPSKGTLNESDYLGFPEMRPEQSKEEMISYLSPRASQPYKKRKLESRDLPGNEQNSSSQNLDEEDDSQDMEVDDTPDTKYEPVGNCAFIPALPDEPLPPPPPPSPPPTCEEEEEKEEGEIVEESKPEQEEESTTKQTNKRKKDKSEQGCEPDSKKIKQNPSVSISSTTSLPSLSPATSGSSASGNSDTHTKSSPGTLVKHSSVPNLGSIKQEEMGTPLIPHHVSMEKLPAQEHFSKNICDVINFDNLPDSTGKYKVINKVIKKVRMFMNKLSKS